MKAKKKKKLPAKKRRKNGRHGISEKIDPILNARLEFAMDRLCMGVRPSRVAEEIKEKFSLKDRQAWEYIRVAEDDMVATFKQDRDKIASRLVRRTDKIVDLALARQEEEMTEVKGPGGVTEKVLVVTAKPDYAAAARATELQAKLTGTLITKVEVTDMTEGDSARQEEQADKLRNLREAAKRR